MGRDSVSAWCDRLAAREAVAAESRRAREQLEIAKMLQLQKELESKAYYFASRKRKIEMREAAANQRLTWYGGRA